MTAQPGVALTNSPLSNQGRLRREPAGLRPAAVPGMRPGGRSGRGVAPQPARHRQKERRPGVIPIAAPFAELLRVSPSAYVTFTPPTLRSTLRPPPDRIKGASRHCVMDSIHP